MKTTKLAKLTSILLIGAFTLPAIGDDANVETTPQKTEPAVNAEAQTGATADVGVGQKFEDAAFSRYVNISNLGRAWATLDASLMTDVALQLSEGERVLLRSHKVFAAEDVIDTAVKLATEQNDEESLRRLRQFAERADNRKLIERIELAQSLGESSRAAQSVRVSISEMTPDSLAQYRSLKSDIIAADVLGDPRGLRELHHEVDGIPGLTQEQRADLRDDIESRLSVLDANESLGGASRSLAEDPADSNNPNPEHEEFSDALNLLAAESRVDDGALIAAGVLGVVGAAINAASNQNRPNISAQPPYQPQGIPPYYPPYPGPYPPQPYPGPYPPQGNPGQWPQGGVSYPRSCSCQHCVTKHRGRYCANYHN